MSFCELFAIEPNNAEQSDALLADLASQEKRKALLEVVGLSGQASSVATQVAAMQSRNRIATLPMSPAELAVWGAYLPTVYAEKDQHGKRLLGQYVFDLIPNPVLAQWEAHKQSGLFEGFEIWTPEAISCPDPILVGIAGDARYLLARWGESDANVVTFEDIRTELKARWFSGKTIVGEPENERYQRLSAAESKPFAWAIATGVAFFLVIPSPINHYS